MKRLAVLASVIALLAGCASQPGPAKQLAGSLSPRAGKAYAVVSLGNGSSQPSSTYLNARYSADKAQDSMAWELGYSLLAAMASDRIGSGDNAVPGRLFLLELEPGSYRFFEANSNWPDPAGQQSLARVGRGRPVCRFHLFRAQGPPAHPVEQVIELLDLIEAALLSDRFLDRTQPSRQLVDERDIGNRPASAGQGVHDGAMHDVDLCRGEQPGRVCLEPTAVGPPQEHLAGVELRPPSGHEGLDIQMVVEPAEEVVPIGMPDGAQRSLGQGAPGHLDGEIVLVLAQDLGADPGQCRRVQANGIPGHEGAQLGRDVLREVPGGPGEHLAHP